MVVETHMKLYLTELGFPEKFFLPPKLEKLTKNGLKTGSFEFTKKMWSLIFTEFILQYSDVLFAVFLHKSHIWEKFCS